MSVWIKTGAVALSVCGAVHAQSETELRARVGSLEKRLAELESARTREASAGQEGGVQWKDLLSVGKSFKIYGFARLDAMFDDSRPNNTQTIGWILSEDPTAPVNTSAGQPNNLGAGGRDKEDFTMHPRLSRIGIDVAGGTVEALGNANATGKIEVDFFNNGLVGQSESRAALRMRHAWLKLAWTNFSVLFGQTSDVISPLFPIVNSDLVMWGAGNLGDRRPQIRPEYTLKSGAINWAFTGEIGLSGADDNADADSANTFGVGYRDGETSGKPTFQARVGAKFPILERTTEFGVWGHIAEEEPDTSFNGRNNFESNAVGLDLSLPLFCDALSFKGEIWQGKNVDDVRGGIFQGINATTGREIDSEGGFAEFAWKATERMTLHGGWATDNPDNGDLNTNARAANKIWYAAARWNFNPLSFGLEYLDWTTEYVGLKEGQNNRVVAFAQMSF